MANYAKNSHEPTTFEYYLLVYKEAFLILALNNPINFQCVQIKIPISIKRGFQRTADAASVPGPTLPKRPKITKIIAQKRCTLTHLHP